MGIFSSTLADLQLQDLEYHIPTTADVDEVRSCLTCFVPVELANLIVDYAMYWPKVTHTVALSNSPLIVTQDTGPKCCALTPKLSSLIGLQLKEGTFWKVKMVYFRISSHDQGWCDQNNFKEPYAGSWTWFEAAIAREVPRDTLLEKDKTKRNDIQRSIREAITERGEEIPNGSEICTVCNVQTGKERSSMWHIQRNRRASREFTMHEVIWTDEESSDEVDRMPGEEMRFVDATGAGKGHGFVDTLEPEDRIAVIARALYPGWMNFTEEVEVDVYYSV